MSRSKPSIGEATLAVGLVLVASLRVRRWFSGRDLSELVEKLRAHAEEHPLCRPEPRVLAGVCERLLPYLPPFGMGACVKRCLILLYLCSRSGLSPRIHFGLERSGASEFHGHVWLSASENAAGSDSLDSLFPPTAHRDALVL